MEHRTSGLRSVLAGFFKTRSKDVLAKAVACTLEDLERRVLMSTTPVVPIKWAGHNSLAFEDQYIALVKPGVDFNAIAAKQGFTDLRDLGGGGFWQFTSTKPVAQVQRWSHVSPNVISVSPNYQGQIQSTEPNDPNYLNGNQWHLNNTGQIINDITGPFDTGTPTPGVAGADIDAKDAWDITTGSSNVVVAVMDTGIDLTHPDLMANIFTNPGESGAAATDGLDSDGNGYVDDVHGWNFFTNTPDVTDMNGHGTHVSGIIGAVGNNGIGVSGVNWNVKILPLDVSAGGDAVSFSAAIAGINYTALMKNLYDTSGGAEGANVVAVNASFGGSDFPFDRVFSQALDRLNAAGVLFVAAAGNDAVNVDNSFDFPAKFSLNHPGVITVAATDNTDNLAFFSNTGAQSALLAAPGVSIFSTTPTYPVTLTTEDGLTEDYGVLSGTSQATPVVTGILALEKAANPNATLLQLRQALLNGVDEIPSLAGNLSGPRKVLTGGRANAFKALQNVMNPFLGVDNTTRGNWRGPNASPTLYGTEGSYIAGESTTFPTIANGSISGASISLLDDSTKDQRTLQTTDGSTHIAGALVSSTSMTFDFNFTDGKSHQVALYMDDFDHKNRTETIDEIDPTTGAVISGEMGQQKVTGFQNGRYEIFQLSGHIDLRVTRVSGPNAVVNGIFIDPVTTVPGALVSTDAATAGNWRSLYGSQGAYVVGASAAFPNFVQNTFSGATTVVRQSSTKNPVALENPNNPDRNIMAYLSTPTSMSLDLNLTDSQAHEVTLYVADYENRGRAERIDVLDPDTGDVETSTVVSNFSKGKYVTFELTGHNIIRITRMAGTSAVLSGVFFDAPLSDQASYAGIDAVTHGNWKPVYGFDGSYVVGDTPLNGTPTSFNIPLVADEDTSDVTDSVDVNLLGTTASILNASTKNTKALEKTANLFSTDRIIAGLYTHGTETIDLNFNDPKVHRLSLYALDNDNEDRIETITITDANGNVLVSQKLANFQNGKYISFDVRGHVQVHVTRDAGDTAVINGVFFD